jgi:MFS family permease
MVMTLAWAALLPVLPLYVRGPLGGGDIAVGIVMSGALLVGAVAQPLLGRLADARGRRLLLIGGPLLFGSFVSLFSLVGSPSALFALRTAAGLGDAAFMVGGLTVLNDVAPPARRGEAYSIFSLSTWAGIGIGPVLGDLVRREYSFHAVWLMCGCLSIVALIAAILLPETRRAVAPAHSSRWVFNRSIALPGLVLAFEQIGFAALFVFTPLYARHLGMAGGGFVLLANAAVLLSFRIFGRKLPDRLGPGRATGVGLVLAGAGLALPALVASPAGLFAGAGVFGAGHALFYPALFVTAVGRQPEHERSAAVGELKASEAVGFAIGASMLGVVASAAGYRAVFAIAAALAVVAVVPLSAIEQGAKRRALLGRDERGSPSGHEDPGGEQQSPDELNLGQTL